MSGPQIQLLKRIQRLPLKSFSVLAEEPGGYPFPSMVIGCGHSKETTTDYSWDGLRRGPHRFVAFQYTLSGWGMIRYEDRLHRLDAGQAFFIPMPHNHHYYLPADSPHWEFYFLSLEGSEIFRAFRAIEQKREPIFAIRQDSPLHDVFYHCFRRAEPMRLHCPFEFSALAYQFAMTLLQEAMGSPSPMRDPEFIRKVKTYCQKHIHQPISVAQMARVAGYSPFYFSRVFTQQLGVGPRQYLEHIRLQLACELLLSGKSSIKEIAYNCGFADDNYFCKVFRKRIGESPMRYRHSGGVPRRS